MNREYNKLTKEIIKDIKGKYEKAISESAREISFEIEKAYEQVIDAFYAHKAFKIPGVRGGYTNVPKSYKRTYNTYYASDRYDKKYSSAYSRNRKTNVITAGITVSSDTMNDWYDADKEFVFLRTFEQGIHGYSNRINDTGFEMTNTRPPLLMKPTPERLMHTQYWHIGSQRNLKKVVSENMEKAFN